jgi:hypothetical protein
MKMTLVDQPSISALANATIAVLKQGISKFKKSITRLSGNNVKYDDDDDDDDDNHNDRISTAAISIFTQRECVVSRFQAAVVAIVEGQMTRSSLLVSQTHNDHLLSNAKTGDTINDNNVNNEDDLITTSSRVLSFPELLNDFDETALYRQWHSSSTATADSDKDNKEDIDGADAQRHDNNNSNELMAFERWCRQVRGVNFDHSGVIGSMTPKQSRRAAPSRSHQQQHDYDDRGNRIESKQLFGEPFTTSSSNNNSSSSSTEGGEPRILCSIYTIGRRHDQAAAVANTWGQRCDGFIAFSDSTAAAAAGVAAEINVVRLNMGSAYTVNDIEAFRSAAAAAAINERINITRLNLGGEDYENMWVKVRRTLL